jgi:methionyl-tRNA formyltransferase
MLALEHHIPVHQPLTLRDAEQQRIIKEMHADVMVVVAYGLLLPVPVLEAPRFGCINIHASLLPRWRGAAPIQRAIFAGDKETGVTIMQMEAGLDTGPMLKVVKCPIYDTDTSEILHDRLAVIGADALIATLNELSSLQPEVQQHEFATYAHKIKKEEAILNWQLSAEELNRIVHAFIPWPVAMTACGDKTVRIWQSSVVAEKTSQAPGTIVQTSAQGIDVATGDGILRLQKIQFPGGKALPVADILNSSRHDFVKGGMLQ